MIGYWVALAASFAAGSVLTLLATERRRADVREQLDFVHRWEEQGLQPARHWAELRTAAYTPPPAVEAPFDVGAAVATMPWRTRLVWRLSQPRWDWALGWAGRKAPEPVGRHRPETIAAARDGDTTQEFKRITAGYYSAAAAHVVAAREVAR